jgi:hypothetical protein
MPLKQNGFGVVDVVFFAPLSVFLWDMYGHVERLDSTVIHHRKKSRMESRCHFAELVVLSRTVARTTGFA